MQGQADLLEALQAGRVPMAALMAAGTAASLPFPGLLPVLHVLGATCKEDRRSRHRAAGVTSRYKCSFSHVLVVPSNAVSYSKSSEFLCHEY